MIRKASNADVFPMQIRANTKVSDFTGDPESMDFIFMLTRNDRTIEGAAEHVDAAIGVGVEHMGFKDVGLPFDALAELSSQMKAAGATSYLEIVSLDAARERESAEAALELGVDCLLGGTHVEQVLPILEGTGIRYFPFPGRITGHPSVLEGNLDDLVESALRLCGYDGVAGVDLLAYRWAGDGGELVRAVCHALEKPVIVAGSIDRPERIELIADAGAAGFTIGTAVLDGRFPGVSPTLSSQLGGVLEAMAPACERVSPE
jgi:hypothetical protein